jgi:TonB family protein
MKASKEKRIALIGTLIFHGLLLLALTLLALRTPLPLPGEQGVEVNLGTTEAGIGKTSLQASPKKIRPKKRTKVIRKPKPPAPKPSRKPIVSKQKNLTQNTEKAPSLKKKHPRPQPKPVKKAIPKTKPVKKKADTPRPVRQTPVTKKQKPVVNQRALFKVSPGNRNASEGIKAGSGDQGKPHGFKQSKAYKTPGGEGHGISFSLGNRGASFLARPSTQFTEQGTVVVRIEVNPQGKVVNARIFAKGTTVVSENLRRIAVQSARNSLFSADPAAPAIQIGTITYHFILKK